MSETIEICPIGTRERLFKLLRHELPEEEQRRLSSHLEEPCETCLSLLEEIDEDELLDQGAGPRAALTGKEADSMFNRVTGRDHENNIREMHLSKTFTLRILKTALPLAAAAVLLLAFGLIHDWNGKKGSRHESYIGLKGGKGPEFLAAPVLKGFVGKLEDGRPKLVRRLLPGDILTKGELVLLKYRISAPSFIYLIFEAKGESRIIFSTSTKVPAGEHELAANGRTLAVDPSQLGDTFRLTLVASSVRVQDIGMKHGTSGICPGCAAASILIHSEADR
ncbi:MAG: zf-HC2 domain-containing protein [Deltaproteobacteria bacterium]|nr:zf-HC2 domain-containing protein [Deltaproteobacteria bacterium]